ncbi:MAG: sulfonate/nitrate transporter, ATPase [Actinotalea sp.]|nr:sulfonate/nitrate transporter, ATPase [Actinotalea sp.]
MSHPLTATTQPKIQVDSLSVEYPDHSGTGKVTALDTVDLTIGKDEFVTLLGPSGCGKSTLLFTIAGLIKPTSGAVRVDGTPVDGPGADRGVVFQDYALLPWRTVRQNIALGLTIAGAPKARRIEVADEYISLFGLDGFGDRYPHELSGGMRQRVAVARTLANTPEVVLMDEPFAAVDAQTRAVLGEELARISATHRMTVAFVTHSVEEAVLLGDRVVVMTPRPGRIRAVLDVPVAREERSMVSMRENPVLIELTREATSLLSGMRGQAVESGSS